MRSPGSTRRSRIAHELRYLNPFRRLRRHISVSSCQPHIRTPFAVFAGLCLVLSAITLPAHSLTDSEREEFQALIRSYLLSHPELMIEVFEALEQKRESGRDEAVNTAIQQSHAEIYTRPADPTVGPANASRVIVEFFDYNCGFCRRSLGAIKTLVEEEDDLRIVFKEFPILGRDSVEAAKVSLRVFAAAPDKYFAFHKKLLAHSSRVDGERARAVARDVGVAAGALEPGPGDIVAEKEVEAILELAQRLNISGTPTFIIGNTVVPGAQSLEQLRERLSALPKKASNR